ncbi:MAG: hypothetical protein ACI4I2_01625 [Oscillospiraceae bacterium]
MFNYKGLEDMTEQFRTMFDIVKIVDPVLGKVQHGASRQRDEKAGSYPRI